jgi:hypothetical protein
LYETFDGGHMRGTKGIDDSRLVEVIGRLYDAVVDESRWPDAIGGVAAWLDSHGAMYAGIVPTTW